MCGACGIKPDWAGSLVSGPIRRRDIARCLNMIITFVKVSEIPRGWMIKSPTGASTPAQNFDELINALTPRARHHTWSALEEALLQVSAPSRVDEAIEAWPSLASQEASGKIVLGNIQHLPAHMKLAAFALGVQTCDFSQPISVDFGNATFLNAVPRHILDTPFS